MNCKLREIDLNFFIIDFIDHFFAAIYCDRKDFSLLRLNFSLTQLEYALAVHRHGHFGKAAKACLVTQPTLSMQIQKLEEALGLILFDRSKKPVLLTNEGQPLFEQMKAIVHEAKKLDTLRDPGRSGDVSGELSLGIIPTIAPYLLPKLFPVMAKMHPSLRLRIFEMQTQGIVEALHDDEINVGLLATPLKVAKIQERSLYWEPFSVLCKKDHALSKLKKVKYSELRVDDVWLLEDGHCLRHQVLDVCSRRQSGVPNRKYHFEGGSLETLKSLVNSYGGYTLLPFLATETLGKNTVVVPFERPFPARRIGLVFRRQHHMSALLNSLAEAILASVPDLTNKSSLGSISVLPVGRTSLRI